jgi:hypothetical protein
VVLRLRGGGREPSSLKMLIKFLNGLILTLEVKDCQTIKSVKEQIEKEEGIPAAKQILTFNGKEMRNEATL